MQDGELAFDWGVNAAVLFGKQKAHVRHYESAHSYGLYQRVGVPPQTVYVHPVADHSTRRSVTVPNIGGSVGFSYRVQEVKVSIGYRADLFTNAMDTGIDKRNTSNVLFHGPYAIISIGLGD